MEVGVSQLNFLNGYQKIYHIGRIASPIRWKRAIDEILRPLGLSFIISNLTLYVGCETLEPQEINRFPCDILNKIDQLWTTYSNGHFGFSVQMSIYEEIKQKNNLPLPSGLDVSASNEFIPITSVTSSLGFNTDSILSLIEKLEWSDYRPNVYRETYWRNAKHFKYNINAPKGHLPFLFNYEEELDSFEDWHMLSIEDMTSLWNRLKSCKY